MGVQRSVDSGLTLAKPSKHSVLAGGGEMGALMRSMDWSRTAVGPVETWPQSLRTALSILLETGFPMYIAWGKDFTQFYNDGYRPILGSTKHPFAMGRSTRESFAEIWDIIGPMFEGVMSGTATTVVDFLLPLDRHGFVEECYFIFSYSPIRQENGDVGGVLVTVTETTQRVIGERRLKTSQALVGETRHARTVREVCEIAGGVLADNPLDLPAARISLWNADAHRLEIVAEYGERERLADDGGRVVLPITEPGAERPAGMLVAAVSPRLVLDDAYRSFLALVASQIGTAIAGTQALEAARARAEALAELDRTKTTFFNNVSHELRTPLTLMLGPAEEALASPERALSGEDLSTVYRNTLRLLKLVNTLLDFSRMEAGRAEACYQPTDLAAITRDHASAFRSAVEKAGLELHVDCPTLPEPIYVDPEMWEKVVLNLISNAFKFTFEGSIGISLVWRGASVELRVRDSGIGMESSELERVFDRFHRVERARSRTQEGSGIGLSLVREIVNMHGGTIRAESTPGEGTTFIVELPTGRAHLPSDRIRSERRLEPSGAAAVPYVQEALSWLPRERESTPDLEAEAEARTDVRILVADDNADMRAYITRLLGARWSVDAVTDGVAAVEAARQFRPDVVITDVMMPRLDGFQVLEALRADPETQNIPVVLLSARAGEEARIDGLKSGADDYLVKPFSARELVARVEAQIVRSKVRGIEEAHARRLASVFTNAPVGVAFLRGQEHVFEFANDAYLELVGNRSVRGKRLLDALPELRDQGISELLDGVYFSGKPHVGRSLRMLIAGRDGQPRERFFDFVYQPLFDEAGRVTGTAVVAFDVTELAAARRAAEAASRAKDEFLAMLGHELRNPLAPILTALHLMRLRGIGGERERSVIERQVEHMVSLVDDLLDVSRITRGKIQLKHDAVDLADVVATAIEMTSPAMEERRHVLQVDVPRGLVVRGDEARLAQVVANLLTNAAKYTDPNGRIRITARRDRDDAVLVVADDGAGIAPEMLPHVFDLFSQEPQSIERSEGGLGLGLAIVKSLVTAHDGSVRAHSAGRGQGSEFEVRLPLASTVRAEAPRGATSSLPSGAPRSGLKILVVDDNHDAAELLATALLAVGHEIAVAHDGPTALAVARDVMPDVALLDIGLPVMDGYELARRLRALPGLESVKLAAITGYGQESDRAKSRIAGFDAHLIKPVAFDALQSWLADS
jgi:signal transduction histidine kinase/AmiR/NasT family two-component response regulator